MNNMLLKGIVGLVIVGLFWSCQHHPYEEMVKKELASGKRYDSLFLGLKLAMSRQEFYDQCWKLNKDTLVKEGPSNMSVEYKVPGTKYPAVMRFYPNFYQDTVYEMSSSFTYEAWAPWNKHLFADSLVEDVKGLIADWYGDGFVTVDGTNNKKAFVKVNGNRRISVYKVDDQYVHVLFTDLTKEEEVESQIKKPTSKND